MKRYLAVMLSVILAVSHHAGAENVSKSTAFDDIRTTIKLLQADEGEKQCSDAKNLIIELKHIKGEINQETLTSIIGLIHNQDSCTQKRVVMALSYVGPRASAAIPALQKVLHEEECTEYSDSSVPTIRDALERIGGIKSPPPDCP